MLRKYRRITIAPTPQSITICEVSNRSMVLSQVGSEASRSGLWCFWVIGEILSGRTRFLQIQGLFVPSLGKAYHLFNNKLHTSSSCNSLARPCRLPGMQASH
jgi:hypothetical protein